MANFTLTQDPGGLLTEKGRRRSQTGCPFCRPSLHWLYIPVARWHLGGRDLLHGYHLQCSYPSPSLWQTLLSLKTQAGSSLKRGVDDHRPVAPFVVPRYIGCIYRSRVGTSAAETWAVLGTVLGSVGQCWAVLGSVGPGFREGVSRRFHCLQRLPSRL